MRIAIITDIHENFQMLEKSHAMLRKHGYDMLVCLGDITGYSPLFYSHTPDANACADLLREHAHIVIAGNHDLHTAARLPSYHIEKNIPAHWYEMSLMERLKHSREKLWLYEEEIVPELSTANQNFLAGLREWAVYENEGERYLFTHFFRPDISGISRWFPVTSMEIYAHFRFMKEHGCQLAFTGHAHPPGPTLISWLKWSNLGYCQVKLRERHKAVICPAVVGERHPGCCLVFDTTSQTLTPLLVS